MAAGVHVKFERGDICFERAWSLFERLHTCDYYYGRGKLGLNFKQASKASNKASRRALDSAACACIGYSGAKRKSL